MEVNENRYKIKQVAKMLNLHFTKVYKLIASGQLRAINVSSGTKRPSWRVPQEFLEEFLEKRENNGEKIS